MGQLYPGRPVFLLVYLETLIIIFNWCYLVSDQLVAVLCIFMTQAVARYAVGALNAALSQHIEVMIFNL